MAFAEDELESLARQRIGVGALPCAPAARMWGSYGTGAPCSPCDHAILAGEVEYEVQTGSDASERVLRFHLACHAVWQAECMRLRRAPAEAG